MGRVKDLLKKEQYTMVNNELLVWLGAEAAITLTVLIEGESSVEVDEDGWFYQTSDTIEKFTGFTYHIQSRALKKLVEVELIEQCNRGVPMKRYFRINEENLKTVLFKDFEFYFLNSLKTKFQNLRNNTYISYTTIINRINFNKLKSGDKSPLNDELNNSELETPMINKNKIISEENHLLIKSLFTSWGKHGTKHKLLPIEKEQTNTTLKILSHITAATEDVAAFYESISDKLDPSWVKLNNISLDYIKEELDKHGNDSEKLVKLKLREHCDALDSGAEKENFKILSRSLKDFFLQEQTDKDKKSINTSWLLYWICKPYSIQKEERKKKSRGRIFLDPEHKLNKLSKYYTKFGTLNSCSTVDDVTCFVEYVGQLFDTGVHMRKLQLKESPLYVDKDLEDIRVAASPSQVLDAFLLFYDSNLDWITRYPLKVMLPGGTIWNSFLDYIFTSGKHDNVKTLIEKQDSKDNGDFFRKRLDPIPTL